MLISIIALLTDFSTRDWFVASMKAVIARINPGCKVIDISHEITPRNITEAAFVLWNCYSFFPSGTVFVCVVDPGVGTGRKILLVKTGRYIFLAPDNGLLDLVLAEEKYYTACHVTNRRYFLKNISSTFHGRDIFAPVAAYLTRGIKMKGLGSKINYKRPESIFLEVTDHREYKGKIIYVDRFGNLITNLRMRKFMDGTVKVKDMSIQKISNTYADGAPGTLVAVVNSSGLLEIGVRNANAKEVLNSRCGDEVVLIIAPV